MRKVVDYRFHELVFVVRAEARIDCLVMCENNFNVSACIKYISEGVYIVLFCCCFCIAVNIRERRQNLRQNLRPWNRTDPKLPHVFIYSLLSLIN